MRRLHPAPVAVLDDAGLLAAYEFPAAGPWLRGSMVATLDGVIRGSDGTSRSIASPADQRVFSVLRAAADVVMVGAGTLRDEDYRPARLPLAIVSASGRLPAGLRLFTERGPQTPTSLLLTTDDGARAAAGLPLDVVACGAAAVDLDRARGALVDRGLARIHCEGGPALLGSLAAAGLLDELLLTVVPLLHGGGTAEHLLTVPGGLVPAHRLHFTQVLEEDGSVFLRAAVAA